ncbi:hypothetical protein O6H91_11G011500 [Diphasiastrum complanatum]|uniref:Uncharacterized protein n=1 Tax=Diphasiastrum complanatum TaxID=34168 RepID=A0ACC2C6G8_DIPCM|nr:hypothetical protein O6H91_11G011500 [Diphasiastrum complanatum]
MQISGMLTTDYYLDPVPSLNVNTDDFENSDCVHGMMGNSLSNTFSSQLYSSSSRYPMNNIGFQDTVPFIEHPLQRQRLLQLLEETSCTERQEVKIFDPAYLELPVLEELPYKKLLASVPQLLGVQLQNCLDQTAIRPGESACVQDLGQPEVLSISTDSQCSPALTNNPLPNESNQNGAGYTQNVDDYSHQESGQSRSASNSEKSPKDELLSTYLPFSCGQSQSSCGPSNQKRLKRKRTKFSKNIEEVESQRQTHIAVERNRRKQMNEHLSALRSLMPGSYVQRGDQASIVGGAIEFIKELEQLLECLQEQKQRRMCVEAFSFKPNPFSLDTFSLHDQLVDSQCYMPQLPPESKYSINNLYEQAKELFAKSRSDIAEVEVKMIGRDVLLKILSPRISGQLVKTIASLESLGMTILHTNITTIEQTVLLSFNVKLKMECHLATVEEIAAAVQHIFRIIHNGRVAF